MLDKYTHSKLFIAKPSGDDKIHDCSKYVWLCLYNLTKRTFTWIMPDSSSNTLYIYIYVFTRLHVTCRPVFSSIYVYVSARIYHNFLPRISVVKRGMAQAVSRRPFKVVTWDLSQASPCGICGGKSDTGTGLSLSPIFFPCQSLSTIFPYTLIYLPQKLYSRKNWQHR